jgi:hypothetical protein
MLELKQQSMGEVLATRANSILEVCKNFIINDQSSYEEADRKVSETASLEKGIAEYWAEPKATAHKAWKAICTKEKEMLEPIKQGSKILSANMSAYRRAFTEAEQRKRDEEIKKAKEQAQLEAFKLAEQGVDEVAVEAVLEMAEEPVSVAPVAELRGKTSFVLDYEVKVIPGQEHLIPKEILQPTTPQMVKALEAKIKKLAKVTGGQKIAGIEITQIQTARRRTV